MFRNVAGQVLYFDAILVATGGDATGITPTVSVSKDGGAITGGAGTLSEIAAGAFRYLPTQSETDAACVAFIFKDATMITRVINIYPITQDEYKAEVSGLSTFNPDTDTVATVGAVANVTNPVATDTASRDASKADVSGLATATELAKVPKKDAAQTWTNQAGDTQTVTVTQA